MQVLNERVLALSEITEKPQRLAKGEKEINLQKTGSIDASRLKRFFGEYLSVNLTSKDLATALFYIYACVRKLQLVFIIVHS